MDDQKDEFLLDEINGCRGKKPKMAALNKKQVSSWEMDELFVED